MQLIRLSLISVGTYSNPPILAVGYVLPLAYLLWSMRFGSVADRNPWRAKGLEWTTLSPPPPENFERMPEVTEPAYAYGLENETDG